jgi:hypothetical protein
MCHSINTNTCFYASKIYHQSSVGGVEGRGGGGNEGIYWEREKKYKVWGGKICDPDLIWGGGGGEMRDPDLTGEGGGEMIGWVDLQTIWLERGSR